MRYITLKSVNMFKFLELTFLVVFLHFKNYLFITSYIV